MSAPSAIRRLGFVDSWNDHSERPALITATPPAGYRPVTTVWLFATGWWLCAQRASASAFC